MPFKFLKLPLDGEKEYVDGEYTFQIKIPKNFTSTYAPPGTVGSVLQMVTGTSQRINWYVKAYLDIQMGLNVSGKV